MNGHGDKGRKERTMNQRPERGQCKQRREGDTEEKEGRKSKFTSQGIEHQGRKEKCKEWPYRCHFICKACEEKEKAKNRCWKRRKHDGECARKECLTKYFPK